MDPGKKFPQRAEISSFAGLRYLTIPQVGFILIEMLNAEFFRCKVLSGSRGKPVDEMHQIGFVTPDRMMTQSSGPQKVEKIADDGVI